MSDDLQAAVDAADRAAVGDSNDSEIGALRDALDEALSQLEGYGVTIERKDWDADDEA